MRIIVLCGSTTALPSLNRLWKKNYLSALIYSSAGVKQWWLPLETWAEECGLPCWHVEERLLQNELTELIREIQPDLILAYDFPYRLPSRLVQHVRFGAWHVQFGFHSTNQGSVTIQHMGRVNHEPEMQLNFFLLPAGEAGSAVDQLNLLSLSLLQTAIGTSAQLPGGEPQFL